MSSTRSLAQQRLLDSYKSKVMTAKLALILFGAFVFIYSYLFYGLSPQLLILTVVFAIAGVGFILLGSLSKRNTPTLMLVGFIISTVFLLFSWLFFGWIGAIMNGIASYYSYRGWQAIKELQKIEPDVVKSDELLDSELAHHG